MSLNKILLLNEDQLLKLIIDNGYEDIANIISNRKISGKRMLELSEFETISWRLSPRQMKDLFNFIKQVKENPYATIKKGLTATKPARVKPSKPQKPDLALQTRASIRKISEVEADKENDSNHKLPNTLEASSTKRSARKISPQGNQVAKPPMPLPEVVQKPVSAKPTPVQIGHKLNSHHKVLKPLPNEPPKTASKPKQFLPEPKLSSAKPADQPKNIKQETVSERSGSPELVYEDIDQLKDSKDYGYLSPNECEFDRDKSPIFKMQQNIQNASRTSLNSREAVHDDEVEDEYEPPPNLSKKASAESLRIPAQVNRRSPLLSRAEEANLARSSMEDRPPLPLPTETLNIRSKVINDLVIAYESDEEISDYEALPEIDRNKNYDSDNFTMMEKEQQRNNKIGFLGSMSRFFANKNKPKIDTSSSNYENHMLKTEMSTISINKEHAYRNRPLPEIPSIRTGTLLVSQSSISQRSGNSPSRLESDIPKEIEQNRNKGDSFGRNNQNFNRRKEVSPQRGSLESDNDFHDSSVNKSWDNLPTPTLEGARRKTPSPKLIIPSDLAHNLSEALKAREKEFQQQTLKVDNKTFAKNKSYIHNNHKAIIPPEEDIEDDNDLPSYKNIDDVSSDLHTIAPRRNFVKLKTPPVSEGEDDEDNDAPFYGNIDELSVPSSRADLTKPKTPPLSKLDDNKEDLFYRNVNDGQNRKHPTGFSYLNRNSSPLASPVEVAEDVDDENIDDQPVYGNVEDEVDEPTDEFNGEDEEDDEEDGEEYIDTIFNINNEKFFRNTDRKGAKALLKNLADGAFLFRPSEKHFLVLTLKHNSNFYNIGIERTKNNKIRLNADMTCVSPEFGTLRSFVNYFAKEPVTFTTQGVLKEIYLNPVLPVDLF